MYIISRLQKWWPNTLKLTVFIWRSQGEESSRSWIPTRRCMWKIWTHTQMQCLRVPSKTLGLTLRNRVDIGLGLSDGLELDISTFNMVTWASMPYQCSMSVPARVGVSRAIEAGPWPQIYSIYLSPWPGDSIALIIKCLKKASFPLSLILFLSLREISEWKRIEEGKFNHHVVILALDLSICRPHERNGTSTKISFCILYSSLLWPSK